VQKTGKKKTIVCVGTLDTKAVEIDYVKKIIEKRGHRVILIDTGILGEPGIPPDITREDVAKAAGSSLEEAIGTGNERKAVEVLITGLGKILNELHGAGRLDGVISLGGGMGTSIITAAMRQLPLGVPKFMVSTKVAHSGAAKEYMGTKDITMVSSPADIAGLNRLTRRIMANAAGAVIGMVEGDEVELGDKPVVAMTMTGWTTKGASMVHAALERQEYEVVVFHGIGVGGRALEEFVKAEPVEAVIEFGMNEIANDLFGGMATAGPHRLEAAGEKGVLQIITLGSVDYINFLGVESMPPEHRKRALVPHNPEATGARLFADEMKTLAGVIAEKLNKAKGPVKVLVPMRGFSHWNAEGKIFHNPDADRGFLKVLREKLHPSVLYREIDAHINDDRFAQAVMEEFMKSLSESGKS
jgi:uncharacterized protein (UPF0261 family)